MPRDMTAAEVNSLTKPGLYRVSPLLYLRIRGPNAKSYLFRYRRRGVTRWMGLGPASVVSLSHARADVLKYRFMLHMGTDPLAERRAGRRSGAPTFSEAAADYIAAKAPGWRNAKHVYQWRSTLAKFAEPRIGRQQVNAIRAGDIADVLRPIWLSKPETATRLRGRIEMILNAAIAAGHIPSGVNPAKSSIIRHLLPKVSRTVVHHPALPYSDLPALVAELGMRDTISAKALLCTILCAARTGEVINAVWSEVNFAAAIWEVPAVRMKSGRAHSVPLSPAVIELLQGLPGGAPDAPLFPNRAGRPLSNMTMLKLLRELRPGVTVHGTARASCKTWASECTDFPREVVELCLAHVVGGKVERSYMRGEMIDKRRALLDQWSSYLTGVPIAGSWRPTFTKPRRHVR